MAMFGFCLGCDIGLIGIFSLFVHWFGFGGFYLRSILGIATVFVFLAAATGTWFVSSGFHFDSYSKYTLDTLKFCMAFKGL
jgi:hypothetical protein